MRIALFQLGLMLCHTGRAAVGFSITPEAVSNTYNGEITLLVTNLNPGNTVVVQKYLDANADGIIDAGDVLVQQFNLTDGKAGMVIGGVTNFNVPGDTDTVSGQITAELNLQADFSQTIVGDYLFKVSSPSGDFTAITNALAVTNYPYAQKFSGTVFSNGVAVPYAPVLVFQSFGGNNLNPVGGTVANISGSYNLPAPPGTYALAAFKSNFVANTGAAANLLLGGGLTINTNLTLIPATNIISGSVVDANSPSIGLPGIFLPMQSTNGLLGICYTDTNGNFNAAVTSNQWKVGGDSAGPVLHGYVSLQNKVKVNISTNNVSGLTIALPKGTALFYGTVKDNLGNPFPGLVEVGGLDNNETNNSNGEYQTDGYTDANGNFATAIVGGLGTNDQWQVNVDNASSFPNYDFSQPFSQQNGYTNVSASVAVQVHLIAILATNVISGTVKFDGSPVANVQVNANSEDSTNYQAQATTDNNGNYSLNVGNATWNVYVNCQGDNNSLDSVLGLGNYQCPCSYNVTISNNNVTTNFTVLPAGGSGEISGHLTNACGVPLVGVNVYANSTGCNGNGYSTSTAGNGSYSFNGLPNGVYDVSVDCNALNSRGYGCLNDTNVTVSSDDVQQNFTVQCFTLFLSGRVVDSSDNPVTGMNLFAGTNGGPPSFQSTTDSGGNFIMGMVGGNYVIFLNNDPNTGFPTLGLIGPSVPVSVTNGDNITNFIIVCPRVTGAIQVQVNGTGGTGVANIGVFAHLAIGITNYNSEQIQTANSGAATVPACNGSWQVSLNCNDTQNQGYMCPSAQNVTVSDNTDAVTFNLSGGGGGPLQVTTSSLPNGNPGVAYSAQLEDTGGQQPYNCWSLANGSANLPAGLSMNCDGLISGKPTTNGSFFFIVQAEDANLMTATKSLGIIINPQPRLSLASWRTNQFQMRLVGGSNQNYTLQKSTNIGSTNWFTLYVTNNSGTNTFLVIDPNATNKQGFYRILIGP
ncbi:MAG TPA: carboxypeptidase regulatory-like domain-containing protein [Verrucomicrobiae bacterium]